MKDPLSSCAYNMLYQDLKRFSRNGENFCKELVAAFQQRSKLEITYANRLQKLAIKLINVSKTMSSNSTYNAWSLISNEMISTAEAHRALGQALQQDAVLEVRHILDEHSKRKRPLDGAVDKARKHVVINWSEQLKAKRKLAGLTREHEALFSFVEQNKQIFTEKEKHKVQYLMAGCVLVEMLNRLGKSAELQVRADENYLSLNLDSYQIRLRWEATLRSCYQILQELEKQRIETLSRTLYKYNLYMCSYGQSLTQSQDLMEEAIGRVDADADVHTLVDETCVTADDHQAEFLLTDYYEEDAQAVMDPERRKEALKSKLQRLEEFMNQTKKDKEGLEESLGPNLDQKDQFESEQLHHEFLLKLDLLEASYHKLNQSLMEVEGKPKASHRFSQSILTYKEKDCEHSIVRFSHPVRIKKTPFRSSLRNSGTYKRPDKDKPTHTPDSGRHTLEKTTEPETGGAAGTEFGVVFGRCKVVFDYSSERKDELQIKEGDLLEILCKDESGWWFGELDGHRGHFPSNYVEELPNLNEPKSSDA